MKKATKFLTTTLLLASMCTPAFAATPVSVEETIAAPQISYMDENSVMGTYVEGRATTYYSYIDVGVNAAVNGAKRSFNGGSFGSQVYNIECDPIENSGYLEVALCKVSALGSYNPYASDEKSITSTTSSRTYDLGEWDAGTWAFKYATSGSLALYADVSMYSV